jgi:hypothetical protein
MCRPYRALAIGASRTEGFALGNSISPLQGWFLPTPMTGHSIVLWSYSFGIQCNSFRGREVRALRSSKFVDDAYAPPSPAGC